MSRNSTMQNWLADHPRMIGALYVLLAFLVASGTAAATTTVTIAGP